MAYCTKCGAHLVDGARFCVSCGTKVGMPMPPPSNTPSQPVVPPKPVVPPRPIMPPKPPVQHKMSGTGNVDRSGKKSKVWLVLIALVLLVGGGITLYKCFGGGGDGRGLSNEKLILPESLGNSKPVDCTPLKGFHIQAEKDAFEHDVDFTMTPLTSASPDVLKAARQIEDEGYILVAGHELNAGLDDDEIMPGEYTMTANLSELGISPELYPYVHVFRVANNGNYYEYGSIVKGDKLVYRSDQNCALFWAIFIPAAASVGLYLVNQEANEPLQYFYNAKKKKLSCKGKTKVGNVSYELYWNMADIGIDVDDLERRCKAIAQKYEAQKDQLYKQYQEDHQFEATNILHIFSRGKSAAEVLKEAIEKDEERQRIQKELKVPEVVEFTIDCIERAFAYLKQREYMKMPTGVVQIVSVTTLGSNILGQASNRKLHEAYVEISMGSVVNADPTKRNDFLMTMTHELLHVCQQRYRCAIVDDNRYDELVAVFMEFRALEHFMYDPIEEGAVPPLSDVNHWSTLQLPIDQNYSAYDGVVMRHEGYNLGLLAKFISEKTNKTMWCDRLMRARSYWKMAGVSKPLMYAFDIDEQEFDTHYRNFIMTNKEKMSEHYNVTLSKTETYQRLPEVTIEKGGRYRADVRVKGSYSSEVRGFTQASLDPFTLVLVPDQGFSAEQPECMLVPIEAHEKISKGIYIYPLDKHALAMNKKKPNRNILEIHGALGNASTKRSTGYNIYVQNQTKEVIPSEDEENLILKMPENSYMADDGIIDGYILNIVAENDVKIEKIITPDLFEQEVKIEKKDIYKDTDLSEPLSIEITLCEFIKKNAKEKLLGETSRVVSYTLGAVTPDGLARFTGWWIPTALKTFTPDDFVIGLVYLPDEHMIGYYEREYCYRHSERLWSKFDNYDYDERTGVLSLSFDGGTATFRIDEHDHLFMKNSGGEYEFYRAPKD